MDFSDMNQCNHQEGKCSYPNGLSFRPDGVHELDPCFYEEIQRFKNVTVIISRCKRCGHIDISWKRQDDTEEMEVEDA